MTDRQLVARPGSRYRGTSEWVVAKGDKGEQGDRGAPGPGLPVRQRRAIIYLFILPALIAAVALGGILHYASILTAEQQTVARQSREIAGVESTDARQRCGSIAEIVAIPIPVPTAGNPSRQAWARFEQVQRARGTELGCKMPAARYVQVSGT